MPERHQLTVNISEESMTGWRASAQRMGVTVTALLEVVGCRLGSPDWFDVEANSPEIARLREMLTEEARQVDAERRRRR